jgi:hypothetical protein
MKGIFGMASFHAVAAKILLPEFHNQQATE